MTTFGGSVAEDVADGDVNAAAEIGSYTKKPPCSFVPDQSRTCGPPPGSTTTVAARAAKAGTGSAIATKRTSFLPPNRHDCSLDRDVVSGRMPDARLSCDEPSVESVVRRVDRFQQSHRPFWIAFGVVKKFGDDRANSLAALIAYYGFMATFPLLLMLTTITGFLAGQHAGFEEALVDSALQDFPVIGQQFGDAIHPLPGAAPSRCHRKTLGLVWGSLGVTQAAQHAMAEVGDVQGVDRPPFVGRLARGSAFSSSSG